MKKKRIVFIASIVTVVFALILISGMTLVHLFREVPVDNETPAEEIITKECSLERLFLMEAIFSVRDGFGDVYASDLAREVGVKLECKRQPSLTQFYYVIQGGDYRCFIITDATEIVTHVFVTPAFATISATKASIAEYQELSEDFLISDSAENYYSRILYCCGWSFGYRHFLFTLQDGVMVMLRPNNLSEYAPQYFYYSDKEWLSVCDEWNGFVILPIDKLPW